MSRHAARRLHAVEFGSRSAACVRRPACAQPAPHLHCVCARPGRRSAAKLHGQGERAALDQASGARPAQQRQVGQIQAAVQVQEETCMVRY
jgi:hypothetical protein